MALSDYNGWSGKVRDVRGATHSKLIKEQVLKRDHQCELTGVTHGLTFHSEEYGSTLKDMVSTTHELAPYCHGIIHARFSLPNRFKRFKQRIRDKDFGQAAKFHTLFAFFGHIRGISDIAYVEDEPSGIEWLDALTLKKYTGAPKIALTGSNSGLLIPDPKIYGADTNVLVEGLSYDSSTKTFKPYSSIPDVPF